jgi:hypothetical protein
MYYNLFISNVEMYWQNFVKELIRFSHPENVNEVREVRYTFDIDFFGIWKWSWSYDYGVQYAFDLQCWYFGNENKAMWGMICILYRFCYS